MNRHDGAATLMCIAMKILETPSESGVRYWMPLCIIASLLINSDAIAAPPDELIPPDLELAATVRAAVDDPVLTEAERNHLRVFHGLFDELPEASRNTAEAWAARGAWDHPSLSTPDTPALLAAEAAVQRGDYQIAITRMADTDTTQAIALRGRALEGLGKRDQAMKALALVRAQLRHEQIGSAEVLTVGAGALVRLAALEGRPASEYQMALDLLVRAHQQIDRLYWPALVAQARLLIEKDNRPVAAEALHEALALNPNAPEAWFLLGRIALSSFNFDDAQKAIDRLREIHPTHVSADVLEVHLYLTQRDLVNAFSVIDAGLARFPQHRELLACRAAAAALTHDASATQDAFEAFDTLSPGHPMALYLTGRYLAFARQYELGVQFLRQAIERDPNWPAPQIELAMVLSQDGQDAMALQTLRRATELDPFNRRATNTLVLFNELHDYQTLETEHFIIRFRDGIDASLAHDMPAWLEQMYQEVTTYFDHPLQRKTHIEIMPDRRWFAVRITGMPWIWTIGACTGPVVALTPPRHGAHHAGPFDWPRVVRHEFTHTVTLSKTRYRIPHWLTEACSVTQELAPRSYGTCQLLASALASDKLFDLNEINWAFVRPKEPTDRALAYAQAHWMYEYIADAHGHATILRMLDLCRDGVAQDELITRATGQTAEQFLASFSVWAEQQVVGWGLSPLPSSRWMAQQLESAKGEIDAERPAALLAEHPDHPVVLRHAAEAALSAFDYAGAESLLNRYALARPIDTWADRQLAELLVARDRPDEAVGYLEHLDRIEEFDSTVARMLTRIFRRAERLDDAQRSAQRILDREPYDPGSRELGAAIALQRGNFATAERHLVALTIIEPKRARHHVRLAALYWRTDRRPAADAAARRARELEPGVSVDQFIQPSNPSDSEQ